LTSCSARGNGEQREPVSSHQKLGVAADDALARSYRRCRALTRRHGTTYYWSTLVLPRTKRPFVYALYGFCRFADDIVDDLGDAPLEQRRQALAELGDRLRRDLKRGRSDHPVLAAVVHTSVTLGLDPACFDRFLRSMEMDLWRSRYQTYADLCDYMDGSAAVIGELMLSVLEPTSDEAFEPARALGIAFQLTNFLRDVGEDLERGRVYLPWEDVERFGAVPALERRVVTSAFAELMSFEVARTRSIYAEAASGLPLLPNTSRRCVGSAHLLYSSILDELEAAGWDVFSERRRVPTRRKVAVAARAGLLGALDAISGELQRERSDPPADPGPLRPS
jgi:phytoene synthase